MFWLRYFSSGSCTCTVRFQPKPAHILSLIHGIGIVFFGKGFLLTRLVLNNTTSCNLLPNSTVPITQTGCWHPKQFEKAVIILIDALRYDFTVPFQPTESHRVPNYYHNGLSFLYETAVKEPQHALLRPFIADPPTTTLQRLKALTTGSLPTFIEAGTNFAGSAIDEDNFVSQLRNAGKTVVHLGDDTWHALFPDHFDANLTHAYDSFNVRDLHTVDNGVIEHIFPYLDPSMSKSWDVIIGHFLGVDHAGHRYGPEHPAMQEKLHQMDGVIRNITRMIDDTTLLIVMGDHGMDSKGDHGGESDDEVEAALWMYSKTPQFGRLRSTDVPPPTAKERQVSQIDLVPTLSLLLGLPIPFNNLGSPIDEAFAGADGPNWNNLGKVNLLTFQQMEQYQQVYSQMKDLDTNQHQFQKRQSIMSALQSPDAIDWQAVYFACRDWQQETVAMYRRLWANFHLVDMVEGIVLSIFATLFLIRLARGVKGDFSVLVPQFLRSIGLGTAFGASIGPILTSVLPEYFTAISGTGFCVAVGSFVGLTITLFKVKRSLRDPLYPGSFWSWMCLFFTVAQSAGFAANSFTIHEDTISLLFLTTFGVLALVSSSRQATQQDRILGIYHSILFLLQTRLASFSKLCREEQMPGCRTTFYASSNSSTTATWQVFLPYAIALILPELVKAFYKGTASYEGSAGLWIGFCFRIGLLLVALVWTIEAAENGNWLVDHLSEDHLRTIRLVLAWAVLAIAFPVGIATFIWAKPCINLILRDPSTRSTTTSPTTSPTPSQSKPQLTILGYANTYGARYALLLPILTLSIALTLPPMGQTSLALCTWQIFSLLEILDTNGLIPNPLSSLTTTTSSSILSTPSYTIGPFILAQLASFHFFKTGHAATMASIQWSSPFIALRTPVYPWAPFLLLLNTFGPHILCAAAVPLTILWKRPVPSHGATRALWSPVLQAMLTHVLCYAVPALATTLWAAHLRRHLMLYRVFMPRYLMAQMVLLVVDAVMLVVTLGAVRVTGASVGEVFGF